MKKIFIGTFLFMVLLTQCAKADQLAWITKEQAKQTVDYFNDNNIKEVILFCGCCDKDIKEKVTVSKIYFRHARDFKEGISEYYEVVIVGTTPQNKDFKKAVDLAYVHIKKDNKSACLGLELGFQCDPCTQPFDWF